MRSITCMNASCHMQLGSIVAVPKFWTDKYLIPDIQKRHNRSRTTATVVWDDYARDVQEVLRWTHGRPVRFAWIRDKTDWRDPRRSSHGSSTGCRRGSWRVGQSAGRGLSLRRPSVA